MRAIIFANGDAPDQKTIERWITPTDRIIAADGGTRHALSVGITPHVVIGDLDSLAEADRDQLERAGVPFIVYPTHKDYTDLELALRYALEQGATDIMIFSALGGRWDQSLANLMLLSLPELDARHNAHHRSRRLDRGDPRSGDDHRSGGRYALIDRAERRRARRHHRRLRISVE